MDQIAFQTHGLLTPPVHDLFRTKFQAEYDRYIDAMQRQDLPSLLAMLTAQFTWTLLDGSVLNKTATASALSDYFATTRLQDMSICIEDMAASEDEAVLLINERSKGMTETDGKRSLFWMDETIRETWKQTGNTWQIATAIVLSSATTPIEEAETN